MPVRKIPIQPVSVDGLFLFVLHSRAWLVTALSPNNHHTSEIENEVERWILGGT